MNSINFNQLLSDMKDAEVPRPNSATAGTLSGHAAGEPFEKHVYRYLKDRHPDKVYKQFEFLNDLYLKHPQHITVADRYALFNSPTALFLLNRGDKATKEWSPDHIFEEKQNDTADILFHENGFFDLIDVKTRNMSKAAQPPNIISAYKLAQTCARMIDNEEYESIGIKYIEIDWLETDDTLRCTGAHFGDLFKAKPETLYINWVAALQIQFHVRDLDQTCTADREQWARKYLAHFVESARHRCRRMEETYITPFLPYLSADL